MKCGEYRLWKGRKVKILSAPDYEDMGVWEYVGAEKIGTIIINEKTKPCYSPIFKQGRRRIRGYECWWLPLNVARKYDKMLDKEKGDENPYGILSNKQWR